MTPTSIVAYLTLFATAGFLFLFGALLLGRFLRARVPTAQKQQVYECGEPPVGSGFIQFDLRFYVVALVFIVFEVEVAFFFPWATVFGKATQLRALAGPAERVAADWQAASSPAAEQRSRAVEAKYRQLGAAPPRLPGSRSAAGENAKRIEAIDRHAGKLALASLVDMGVFFAVLLVGFAYVWKRGDLNWVRAVRHGRSAAAQRSRMR
jgi:NADH-quinone oxidoreductase subunit A